VHCGTMRFWRYAIALTLLTSVGSAARLPAKGDSNGKKPITFCGRVESVDLGLQTVAIKHRLIPGYLPAMTNDYPVDSKALLMQLKPDDEVTATVYVGDPMLHDVHVVSSGPANKHH
jgi:Cu/Ag efflux protein CusF